MSAKILVTGATGFIGNYVIKELISRNCNVIATSRSTSRAKKMDWFVDVQYIEHDLASSSDENLFEKFNYPDQVIHLAWSGLPNYKALFHFEENLFNQYSFLKNLISNGVRDITVAGTCFEYGMKSGALNEEVLPEPANPYAIAKNTLRLFLEELKKEVKFQLKWVRLFYMYGKGQNPKSLLSQLDQAIENDEKIFNMSGGKQIRDYLPVDEVASKLVSISLQDKLTGIVNCCSGKPITVENLVREYLKNKKTNIKLNLGYYPYPDYEPMEFWGDDIKLKSINL